MSLLILSAVGLAYGGLAANSFSMDRHYADIIGRGAEPGAGLRRRCRSVGWIGILLSLLACVGAAGWHLGPVLWCGLLTLGAIVLTLLLQYAPRRAIQGAALAYLAALLPGLTAFF